MGKQINYYMEYACFCRLAEKALSLGCEIIQDIHADSIRRGCSADLVMPACKRYFFHVPEAGEVTVRQDMNGKLFVDSGYSASGNALIEAGFSYISPEERHISSARLFCMTGYYDENSVWIGRPACVTKIYNALARYVKQLAPYTELTDTFVSTRDETYLQETEYRHKEYITAGCLHLRETGYRLI